MRKILVALALGMPILLPAATAFADEGNWGDRDASAPAIVVQTEPLNLGTVAGDHGPSDEQFHADQEHAR